MTTDTPSNTRSGDTPEFPESLHFVGVGGIGMSGLAQMFLDLGCEVTGSDRALGRPENARIFSALEAAGVKLFPQDGSVYADGRKPDAIVYSTAIEETTRISVALPRARGDCTAVRRFRSGSGRCAAGSPSP